MQLFIPACGDRLTLTKKWEFDLYLEHRNLKFAETQKLISEADVKQAGYGNLWVGKPYEGALRVVKAVLPVGSVIECDRVYIRTFSKSALQVGNDFDSITWKLMKGDKPARNSRFWVKLPDCYTIDYKLETDSLYRDRIKAVKLVMEG
jgi:hypothetical protein